jgi:7-cyano-7-deazaguanine synthase
MSALILLSGGLDSTVLLGHLLSQKKKCTVISFDYGQRHVYELTCAKKIASHYAVEQQIIIIDPKLFAHASSALTHDHIPVEIDTTYVPARNLLFLAHAISFAESSSLHDIYIGANADDTQLFPDCRRPFFDTLEQAVSLGTKTNITIHTPFATFSKKDIIALGKKLSVPMGLTFSCYNPQKTDPPTPCSVCQACVLNSG